MPILGPQAEQTRQLVLSRVAGLSGFLPQRWAAKFTPVDKIRDLYRHLEKFPDEFTLENLLCAMRIHLRVDSLDLARIPATGPAVVVANHPYGVLDSAILTALLKRVRDDVKTLTNLSFGDIPEIVSPRIFVESFQSDRSCDCNGGKGALLEALAWLESGGMLVMFPAEAVSPFQLAVPQIAGPRWNDAAVRLMRLTGASALPVYFCGLKRMRPQMLRLIHPGLRLACPRQQFEERLGKIFEIRIGHKVQNHSIAEIESDGDATEYLRWRTHLLARRQKREASWAVALRSRALFRTQDKIASPIAPELLEAEIAALPPDRCLVASGDLAVYLGSARETPRLVQEVGRLRELTFRQVGEGTGKSLDLDRFDDYYEHLLLWNRSKCELVGAYRAGNTAEILASQGVGGLYTSTLFRYDARMFEKIGPALELGRSFVRPEYQRQYAPLLLLWKGIARIIALHPKIAALFGAVSVSNDYSRSSREIIYRFFKSHMRDNQLAGLVEARQPFRHRFLHDWECSGWKTVRDLDQLSDPIKDLEADGKGLPILLRQYDKLGGKLVAFNIDRRFSDVLDGLVIVDLRHTDAAVLDRYMGSDAAARYRQLHTIAP